MALISTETTPSHTVTSSLVDAQQLIFTPPAHRSKATRNIFFWFFYSFIYPTRHFMFPRTLNIAVFVGGEEQSGMRNGLPSGFISRLLLPTAIKSLSNVELWNQPNQRVNCIPNSGIIFFQQTMTGMAFDFTVFLYLDNTLSQNGAQCFNPSAHGGTTVELQSHGGSAERPHQRSFPLFRSPSAPGPGRKPTNEYADKDSIDQIPSINPSMVFNIFMVLSLAQNTVWKIRSLRWATVDDLSIAPS